MSFCDAREIDRWMCIVCAQDLRRAKVLLVSVSGWGYMRCEIGLWTDA